jgi:hypothetical protein
MTKAPLARFSSTTTCTRAHTPACRWCANARAQRFQRRRQQVSRQLLLLQPGYQRVLLEARGKLAQLQAQGAFQRPEPGPCRLEALVAAQQDWHQ